MLFLLNENFIEIVRERPYRNVLTLMASNQVALKEFMHKTPSKLLPIVHPLNRWMIHISERNLGLEISAEILAEIEQVDRLTAEPINYFCQYAYLDSEGKVARGSSYCWSEELDQTVQLLESSELDLIGDVTCIPLFRVSRALISPNRQANPGSEHPDSTDN
jgi:hypothetical protein